MRRQTRDGACLIRCHVDCFPEAKSLMCPAASAPCRRCYPMPARRDCHKNMRKIHESRSYTGRSRATRGRSSSAPSGGTALDGRVGCGRKSVNDFANCAAKTVQSLLHRQKPIQKPIIVFCSNVNHIRAYAIRLLNYWLRARALTRSRALRTGQENIPPTSALVLHRKMVIRFAITLLEI